MNLDKNWWNRAELTPMPLQHLDDGSVPLELNYCNKDELDNDNYQH